MLPAAYPRTRPLLPTPPRPFFTLPDPEKPYRHASAALPTPSQATQNPSQTFSTSPKALPTISALRSPLAMPPPPAQVAARPEAKSYFEARRAEARAISASRFRLFALPRVPEPLRRGSRPSHYNGGPPGPEPTVVNWARQGPLLSFSKNEVPELGNPKTRRKSHRFLRFGNSNDSMLFGKIAPCKKHRTPKNKYPCRW